MNKQTLVVFFYSIRYTYGCANGIVSGIDESDCTNKVYNMYCDDDEFEKDSILLQPFNIDSIPDIEELGGYRE